MPQNNFIPLILYIVLVSKFNLLKLQKCNLFAELRVIFGKFNEAINIFDSDCKYHEKGFTTSITRSSMAVGI